MIIKKNKELLIGNRIGNMEYNNHKIFFDNNTHHYFCLGGKITSYCIYEVNHSRLHGNEKSK